MGYDREVIIAKEANRIILSMRQRAEKAEARAEALAEALEQIAYHDGDAAGEHARAALARYRGEK